MTRQRNLKCLPLSEKSHSEKAMSCMIPTIWHSGKGKTREISGTRGWTRGGMNRWSTGVFRTMKILSMILY